MAVPKLHDPVAAQQALLAMYAEDMFQANSGTWNPTSVSVNKGWKILGYLTAANAILDGQALGLGERVYYGFLAQSITDASSYIAVVRGTEQLVEWVENIEGFLVPYPGGGMVEQGFYSIYDSMYFTPITAASPNINTGPNADSKAAAGILAIVPDKATVTVIGHSLGSALGTYLMLDLGVSDARRCAVNGALFASPNTGNGVFVQRVHHAVSSYKLYDYIFDLVPHVPPRLPFDPLGISFHPLPNAIWITGNNRQAKIKQDVLCNHHAYCYAAMLDFASVAPAVDTTDCIEGAN